MNTLLKDPEFRKALIRIALNLLLVIGNIAYVVTIAMAVWHGCSVGQPGDFFHFEVLPLKRFF